MIQREIKLLKGVSISAGHRPWRRSARAVTYRKQTKPSLASYMLIKWLWCWEQTIQRAARAFWDKNAWKGEDQTQFSSTADPGRTGNRPWGSRFFLTQIWGLWFRGKALTRSSPSPSPSVGGDQDHPLQQPGWAPGAEQGRTLCKPMASLSTSHWRGHGGRGTPHTSTCSQRLLGAWWDRGLRGPLLWQSWACVSVRGTREPLWNPAVHTAVYSVCQGGHKGLLEKKGDDTPWSGAGGP